MNTINTASLILRLALGTMFVAHGLLKFLVFTLDGTAGFFVSVGLPGWLATPVAVAEVLGGVALIAGFAVRPVAIVLTPVLLGATWVHLGNGWLFTNAGGGWEYPAFLAITTIVVAILGPGTVTLPALFGSRDGPAHGSAARA